MPKATNALSARCPAPQGGACLSPRDAAGQIIDLINARPHSPRSEEIESIIARVSAVPGSVYVPPSGQVVLGILTEEDYKPERIVSPELEAWNAAVCKHLAAMDEAGDDADKCGELQDRMAALTEHMWSRLGRTWSDLVLHAAIAVYWNSGDFPAYVLGKGPEASYDEYALAQVVRSILGMAGLSFDPDGRLLGSDGPGCAPPATKGAGIIPPITPEGLLVREQITVTGRAERVQAAFGADEDAAIARATAESDKLHDLVALVPRGDIIMAAELAYFWSTPPFDEEAGDSFARAAKRLIVDVLAAAGVTPGNGHGDLRSKGGPSNG